MAFGFVRFQNGLQLIGQNSSLPSIAGEMAYDSATDQFIVFDTQQRFLLVNSGGQTISDKNIDDSTDFFTNTSDPTKRLKFDLSGATTGTLLTLADIATTNRTITFPDGTDTLAGISLTQTLTNKTLTGNTAVNLISGSGIFVLNTSGTITVPNGTDTLAGLSLSQILSNKIVSSPTANPAASGILRLANSDSVSWRNSGNSADIALKPDADGFLQYNNIDLVNLSGTQTLTNKTIDTTLNTIKATGITSGYVLTADGANGTSFVAPSASTFDSSTSYTNGSIAVSVAANALTISLKDKAGSNPSAGSPVGISFHGSLSGTGPYTNLSVTSALSITIPSGTTIGTLGGSFQDNIYVYAINNAGTVELAVSLTAFDEGTLRTTLAISGGSSAQQLYSTTARTFPAIRLIGRVLAFEAVAGTWSTLPGSIANIPFATQKQVVIGTAQTVLGSTTSTSYATPTNAPTVTMKANKDGLYKVWGSFPFDNTSAGQDTFIKIAPGVASALYTQEAVTQSATSTGTPFTIVSLVAAASYTFTLQMKVTGGTGELRNDLTAGNALIVEEY